VDLPKHPVVHGHPIHAILSDGPVVLIPLAVAAEVWDRTGRAGSRTRFGIRFADLVTAAAAASATAAGFVGWIDWLTIPPGHPVRTQATVHGVINSTALVAVAAALPAGGRRLPLLAVAGTAILAGAWIGGELVFRFGWRVRPAEEAEMVEERLRDPASVAAFAEARRNVDAFERQKTFLPAG
jgi:uncharacterized membrane protein